MRTENFCSNCGRKRVLNAPPFSEMSNEDIKDWKQSDGQLLMFDCECGYVVEDERKKTAREILERIENMPLVKTDETGQQDEIVKQINDNLTEIKKEFLGTEKEAMNDNVIIQKKFYVNSENKHCPTIEGEE